MRIGMYKVSLINRFVVLFTSLLLSAGALAGDGEVLWWLVGSDYENISATVNGQTVTAGELGVTDARVRYESNDGLSSGYLTIFAVNADGSVSVYDGSVDYGVGLPGWYFGDLSELSGTSYSFVIELGSWESGSWVNTALESERVSYETLADNKHISIWENTVPTDGQPWVPEGYGVVPEPSSGIMTLLGMALLALRRKRREA